MYETINTSSFLCSSCYTNRIGQETSGFCLGFKEALRMAGKTFFVQFGFDFKKELNFSPTFKQNICSLAATQNVWQHCLHSRTRLGQGMNSKRLESEQFSEKKAKP